MRLDANLLQELQLEVTQAAVYLYNRTLNYVNQWKTPYKVFFTYASQTSRIVTLKKPRLAYLKAYGCKAFAITNNTHCGKSRLQRLDPKAQIGYLVSYQASTIYRIQIPSLAKVISTRDVIFNEDTIFNRKVKDLIDSLMHSTLLEIAAYVQTIKLPPLILDTRTESFHKDDTINITEEIDELEDPPGYYIGRKIQEHYPTPPVTPPPAALLAQLMSGEAAGAPKIQSSRTVPKPPTARLNLDEHPIGELFKEA